MRAADDAGAFSAVRARPPATSHPDAYNEVEPAILSFLIVDAVLLHHHAAETAVRYYLAHADDHPAPWTELARQRRGFNKLVRKRLLDGSPSATDVATVVYGLPAPHPFATEEDWQHAVDGTIDFLRLMADAYLDGAPMYNSLKHGLGAATCWTDVYFVESLADPSRPTVAEIQAGHAQGSGPRVTNPRTTNRQPARSGHSKLSGWTSNDRSA